MPTKAAEAASLHSFHMGMMIAAALSRKPLGDDYPRLFLYWSALAVIIIVAMVVIGYAVIGFFERRALAWQR